MVPIFPIPFFSSIIVPTIIWPGVAADTTVTITVVGADEDETATINLKKDWLP